MGKVPPLVLLAFAGAFSLFAENTLVRDGQTIIFYNDAKKEVAKQTIDQDENVVSTVGEVPEGRIVENDENGKLAAEYRYKGGLRDGLAKLFYESGKAFAEVNYLKGKEEGTTKYFFESGKPMAVFGFKGGERDGSGKVYAETGKLLWEAQYTLGVLDGRYTQYYDNGRPNLVETYTDGKLTSKKVYDNRGAAIKEKLLSLYKGDPVDVLPQSVSEYGGGKFITLSKLNLNASGLSGTVQCDTVQDVDFVLAIYIVTKNGLVVVYKDTESELTAARMNAGELVPMFSSRGYTVKGTGRQVSIEFSVTPSSGNVYDLQGVAKTVTIFCLRGTVNPNRFPAGEDGVFPAVSNSLSKDVK